MTSTVTFFCDIGGLWLFSDHEGIIPSSLGWELESWRRYCLCFKGDICLVEGGRAHKVCTVQQAQCLPPGWLDKFITLSLAGERLRFRREYKVNTEVLI